MDEGYWALFCATGEPIFYLLFRLEQEWEEEEAELIFESVFRFSS